MKERNVLIGLGVVVLIAGYLFLPVWQAHNRYEGAANRAEKCAAGQDLMLAWRSLGFQGLADDLRPHVSMDCFIADVQSRVG